MKITCLRTDLANAVANVQRAVSAKAAIPALEGILIKAYNNELVLSGYDLEIGITTTMEATIKEEGEVVVSAKLFSDIVRKMPEEIMEVSTDERLITYIKSGQADYQIVGMSSGEFPDMPKFDILDELTINAGILKNMIRQTIFAISELKDNPIYTGSLYEMNENSLRIVALDGFRMAIRSESVACKKTPNFIVPGKTQLEVLKLITDDEDDVSLGIGQRHIIFRIKNYSIFSRLIEGTFLNYESTIPKGSQTEMVINTRRLLNAVERMALITNERVKTPIKCSIANDGIDLTCITSIGKASDFIDVEYTGKDVAIGFNHKFLIDALKNTESDEVKIIINGALSPMIVKPISGDSFLFLVVPMRLSNEN